MRRILAELKKLAITFEEYKKLYPKTRKTPNDPLFTKPQKKIKKEVPPPNQESNLKTPSQKTEEHPAIKAFKPALAPSPYQKKMTFDEFKTSSKQMKSDDLAWHLMNSDFVANDPDEIRSIIYNHMGVADYYSMTLLNPHVSKKVKDETANWILEKSGLSFVASQKIKDLIYACAEKGIISKKVVDAAKKSEAERKNQYQISEMTGDELRKLSKQVISDNFKHVCQNENAPSDFLVELLNDPEVKTGLDHIKNGYLETSGYMVNVAKRKFAVEKALDVLKNPNLPFEKVRFLENVMDDFLAKQNHKGGQIAQILANHPEINKPENKNLRDKVVKAFHTKLMTVQDKESLEDPYQTTRKAQQRFYNLPTTLNLSEEEFLKILDNVPKDENREYLYRHPTCPITVLKKALSSRSKSWEATRVKGTVFDLLQNRKAFTDKELVQTVKKNLNLDGDPDLLKKFAKTAYVSGKQNNSTKRTVTKVSEEEKKRIAEEMAQTAKHEEFEFEVVEAYDLDKSPHDFETTSQKIGNVKNNLYHGTSFDGAGGILSSGIRIGGEERTGAMFGQGFYIAGDSSKAVQYAGDNFSQHEGEGVVFMLQAALGKTTDMKYGRPQKDDMRYRELSAEEKTIQEDYKKKTGKDLKDKWHYDHDSVSAKAGTSLMYDEYVVKDPSQVQINKVVVVRKKPKVKA